MRPGYWLTGNALRLTRAETDRISPEWIRAGGLEDLWSKIEPARTDVMVREDRHFRNRSWKVRLWRSEVRMRKLLFASGNCSMPADVIRRINGYDEWFTGWGWEDADFALRLQLAGYRGRSVIRTARAVHLFHETELIDKDHDPRCVRNWDYYLRPRNGEYRCARGFA